MLRRSVPSLAWLLALSGCYVGLPQDEATSDTGTSTGASSSPVSGPATSGPAGSSDMSTGTGTTGTSEPLTGGLTSGLTEALTGTTGTTGEPGTTGTTGDADAVALLCERWKSDRAQLGEGDWSGSVDACDPGSLSQDGRDNALRLVNLYRFLADLPPVTEDPARSLKAQSCALMMHANGQLSHSPPNTWKCWTAEGAEAAGLSNISSTPGVLGVDLYMVDPGNDTTIGHRRWLLSNYLGPIGLGSTSANSCLTVIGGNGNAGKPWLAWPPAGLVPIQALHVPTIGWSSVDQTGWTVQSDSIDLSAATVSVSVGGVDRPVTVNVLGQNYGSSHAIRFVPQGWTAEPGETYEVVLGNVAQPIAYSVTVVDCP